MVPSGAVSLGSPTTCIAPSARVSTSADSTWLFYGKAGGGWVGSDNHTITNTVTGASIGGFSNNTNNGWLVGAGIEWALASNWSVKIEYDYLAPGPADDSSRPAIRSPGQPVLTVLGGRNPPDIARAYGRLRYR